MSFDQCSQNYGYEELPELLERANLILILPKQYSMVPIIKNNQVNYHLAFKQEDGIEIRYTIYPYDKEIEEYKAYLDRKEKGIKPVDPVKGEYEEWMSDPNKGHFVAFQSFVFNLSKKSDTLFQHILKIIKEFPSDAVKNEFNADCGYYAWCDLDKEFGQKYKKCLAYGIHKKDYGMIFCFRMFKDMKQVNMLLDSGKINKDFYCIQFFKSRPPLLEHPKGMNRIFRNG